jgi:hypothetical protein
MVSFIIFTASVRNILDISSYIATWKSGELLLLRTGGDCIPKIAQFFENYIGTEMKIGNVVISEVDSVRRVQTEVVITEFNSVTKKGDVLNL